MGLSRAAFAAGYRPASASIGKPAVVDEQQVKVFAGQPFASRGELVAVGHLELLEVQMLGFGSRRILQGRIPAA